MVLETIIIGVVAVVITIVAAAGAVIGISTYKTIALGLAEIGEVGKNTRERINVRADLAYGDDGIESADSVPSELDGLARLLGYSDVSSAMSDPALLGKLGLGSIGKATESNEVN